MRHLGFMVIFVFGCFSYWNSIAERIDPLWEKVIAQNNKNKSWIPKNNRETLLIKRDDREVKQILIEKKFEQWANDHAVYRPIDAAALSGLEELPSMPIDMDVLFDFQGAGGYTSRTNLSHSDVPGINNKQVVLFEVHHSRYRLKLWVDEDSGKIYRQSIDILVPFTLDGSLESAYLAQAGITKPMIERGSIETNFVDDDEGRPLIQQRRSHFILPRSAKKEEMTITNVFSNYVALD